MKDKKNINQILKTILISFVSGMLGGLLVIYVVGYRPNNTSINKYESPKLVYDQSKHAGLMTGAFNMVKDSVVSVINLQKTRKNNLFTDIFGSKNDKDTLQTYSEGSGVIYYKNLNYAYIATNNHVVADSDQLQVILSDGRKIAAQKVGTDPETDLAVLKVNSKYINQVAKFASSKNLVPGQPVIAVGSPLGSQYATSVTQGIISAKSRVVNVVNEQGQVTNEATVIQTDAAINPGNSGGPLVNEQGQVIGINSMKLSRSGDGTAIEGMGFAIPSDEVVNILNQLVKNGKIVRPKLGIRVLDVTDLTRKDKKRIRLPNNIQEGVAVFSVDSGSSAAKAGIKAKDVIVQIDNDKIDSVASLHSKLYKHKIGDKIPIKVIRAGKYVTVKAILQ